MDTALRIMYRLGIVVAGAMLVACGGSSSGSDSGPTGAAPSAVAITGLNANQAASDAFAATNIAVSGADTAANSVAFRANAQAPALFSLRRFADEYLQRLLSRTSSQIVTPQMVYSTVFPCTGGGTYSDVWNDADNDLVDSPGDSYSTAYANCIEAGVALNGVVTATLFTFSGDVTSDYAMSGTFDFDDFSVSYAGFAASLDGSMSYQASRTGSAASASISIPSFTISEPGGSIVLSDATLEYSSDALTLAYSYTIGATLSSTTLGGMVTVATLSPFTGTGVGYPVTGSMRVTGAGNSSVTLTATGGGNVRLDVDSDGDGVIDSITNTTWAALVAL